MDDTMTVDRSMKHIPRTAMLLDTVISVILVILGIYHLTQPHQAWRSGTAEILCSILLLLAAYRFSKPKAIVTNLVVAVPLLSLSIRHFIHGGGWKSGFVELVFAALLIITAIIIHKQKKGKTD